MQETLRNIEREEDGTNPDPKVILDIGPRGNPVDQIFTNIDKEIQQGAIYIALDSDEKRLKEMGYSAKGDRKRNLVLGDLGDLPFDDNSVNEIWLMNVIGLLERKVKREKTGSKTALHDLEDYLKEMARVLKPNGKAIIGEYFTPETADSQNLIRMDVGKLGLTRRLYVNGGGMAEYLQQLGVKPIMRNFMSGKMQSYFLELKKNDEHRS